jgi:hypothetical protein
METQEVEKKHGGWKVKIRHLLLLWKDFFVVFGPSLSIPTHLIYMTNINLAQLIKKKKNINLAQLSATYTIFFAIDISFYFVLL